MQGDVVELPSVAVPVGECAAPLNRTLSVRVLSRGGGELARNVQEVGVYPASASLSWPSVTFHDPGANLTRLGSVAVSRQAVTASAAPVMVTDVLDEKTLAALRTGSTVVCLVDSATVTPEGFPLAVIARDSAYYDGNWASAMNWVRPSSPVIGWLPQAPRMGFAHAEIGLPFVLGGIGSEWMADVHAGMFIGWLHGSAAYVVQMRVGAGQLLLCTVPVARGAGDDPFATYLFHALVQYAAGGTMQSHRSWNPSYLRGP
jgi:hypothetical protein